MGEDCLSCVTYVLSFCLFEQCLKYIPFISDNRYILCNLLFMKHVIAEILLT